MVQNKFYIMYLAEYDCFNYPIICSGISIVVIYEIVVIMKCIMSPLFENFLPPVTLSTFEILGLNWTEWQILALSATVTLSINENQELK